MTTMMDTVKYKHRSRAALTLALFMGLSSCSLIYDDIDPEQARGNVMLKVDTRGIIVQEPTTTDGYEEYVKTLQLIGVADGVQAFNVELNDLSGYEVQGTEPNTYIEIPLEGEDALPAGAYTIYAVANEEAVTGLSLDALSSVSVPAYTSGTTPSLFLMSDVTPAVIDPRNTNNEISIELVRTLAKIEMGTITKGDVNVTESVTSHSISVSGNVYASYPLFDGTGTGTETVNISGKEGPIYLSESPNDVTVSLSVVIDGTTYTGDYTGATGDFTLERNHAYVLNGTIDEVEQCLQLNISVAPWEVTELKPSYE